jgi:hypothetical protein
MCHEHKHNEANVLRRCPASHLVSAFDFAVGSNTVYAHIFNSCTHPNTEWPTLVHPKQKYGATPDTVLNITSLRL